MMPTGTPARTNQRMAPSGEANSTGKLIDPSRPRKLPMPKHLPDRRSELGLSSRGSRPLSPPPANHHVEYVRNQGARDAEEKSGIRDRPAAHSVAPATRVSRSKRNR